MPAYLDSDLAPIASMPQLKLAAGTAEDMTQMVGALDAPEESGAAGIGASVNPDTMLGGNATFLQDWARLHGVQPPELGPMRVPPELQRPGFPEVLGPSAAPPTVQDGASVADARLAGMWESSEYYGAKPGFQLGSWQVDDLRDTRLPLPMSPPVGGVTGPPGWLGTSDLQDFVWSGDLGKLRHPYQLMPAYPPGVRRPGLGPHPLLPNPDSARTEACGTTEAKGGSGGDMDSYYRNMEAAAGGSFARPDPGSAGAGSAASASSGGRTKEPDDALAEAMKDADPWGAFSWLGNLYGGYAVDSSNPDDPSAMGHAIANATLPFFGLGSGIYDCGNRLSGRRWDNYFNTISPATYNRWGTASIVAGLGIIAGIAFGGVFGAEALASTALGRQAIGAATSWGRWAVLRGRAQVYAWRVAGPIGTGIKAIGDYGERLVSSITRLALNYEYVYSQQWGFRVKPDIINEEGSFFGEVKNWAKLGFTTQMQRLVQLAQEYGYHINLYTRVGTQLHPELQELVRSGVITWYNIIPWR